MDLVDNLSAAKKTAPWPKGQAPVLEVTPLRDALCASKSVLHNAARAQARAWTAFFAQVGHTEKMIVYDPPSVILQGLACATWGHMLMSLTFVS